jgi:hypothetical protein
LKIGLSLIDDLLFQALNADYFVGWLDQHAVAAQSGFPHLDVEGVEAAQAAVMVRTVGVRPPPDLAIVQRDEKLVATDKFERDDRRPDVLGSLPISGA